MDMTPGQREGVSPPPRAASFAEKMDYYRSQHTTRGVRATHLVGIPGVAFSIPVLFAKPRVGVPMDQGSEIPQEVQVLVAVRVPHPGPEPLRDEDRVGEIEGAGPRIPTGHDPGGALVQRVGLAGPASIGVQQLGFE